MGRTLDPPFDPFKDDMSALIATYIIEDVGVTAYKVHHSLGGTYRMHVGHISSCNQPVVSRGVPVHV